MGIVFVIQGYVCEFLDSSASHLTEVRCCRDLPPASLADGRRLIWFTRWFFIHTHLHCFPNCVLQGFRETLATGLCDPVSCAQEENLDLPLAFRNGAHLALLSWRSQPANPLRSWAPLNQVTRLFYLLRWQLYLVSSVAGFKFHLNTHSLMFLPLLGQSQEENLRQTFNPHVFILADSVLNSSWHYLIFHVLNMCFELLKRQKPHLILNTIKWFSTKGKKIKEEEQYK